MKRRDIAVAIGSVGMMAASAAAGITIWILLTAPTTVAGAVDANGLHPLRLAASVLMELVSRLLAFL